MEYGRVPGGERSSSGWQEIEWLPCVARLFAVIPRCMGSRHACRTHGLCLIVLPMPLVQMHKLSMQHAVCIAETFVQHCDNWTERCAVGYMAPRGLT